MRGLLAFVAWSFCSAIGTPSYAAEPEAEMSQKLKATLRIQFCQAIKCHNIHARATAALHCRFEGYSTEKYDYLLKQVGGHQLFLALPEAEKELVRKFNADLEKALILDNFKFTKQHAEQCYADLQNLFEENYQPTFNIELLK